MEIGKMPKSIVVKAMSNAVDEILGNKNLPHDDRSSFAISLIRDKNTLEMAKGENLDDLRKYAMEAKTSNKTKSKIAKAVGYTTSAGLTIAGFILKIPDLFLVAAVGGVVSTNIISTVYNERASLEDNKEKVAARWENLFNEKKADNEEAVKKALESIPEAGKVEYVSGAGCVRTVA